MRSLDSSTASQLLAVWAVLPASLASAVMLSSCPVRAAHRRRKRWKVGRLFFVGKGALDGVFQADVWLVDKQGTGQRGLARLAWPVHGQHRKAGSQALKCWGDGAGQHLYNSINGLTELYIFRAQERSLVTTITSISETARR